MLQCYNTGCGQTYDPADNNDEACRHHPGKPYFHDAYKIWPCCNKKSVDFTEFLSIKGCTVSKHSNVKPPEPVKIINNEEIAEDAVRIPEPIKEPLQRPSISMSMLVIKPTVAPALKKNIDELGTNTPIAAVCNKLAAGEVAVGTTCKNRGCDYSYSGTSEDDTTCTYHPGVPIFHEGMKYWSCCQRKTSDFTNFLAQRGCFDGEHKWFEENDRKSVQCRYDWHQTASDVIVSIYAKMYHYAESSIAVNPIRLNVSLVFPTHDNAKFELDLELRGIIDAKRATAHMYGSKLEIILPKAEPGLWAKLNFTKPQTAQGKVETKASKQRQSSGSDDDFDLDDIETVNSGMRLAEIRQEESEKH